MAQQWEHLEVQRDGRVMTVAFTGSNAVNSLSHALMRELLSLAQSLQDDTELSAIVLTGRPDMFCAGMDLKDPETARLHEATLAEKRALFQLGPRLCAAWEALEPVTIAAIEGWSIGGGMALAVSCDWRVAADDASLYVPELKLGMNMSWQSVPRFNHLIGPARTKQLLILAEPLAASVALDWGLVDYLAEPGQAMARARALAAQVAAMPPVPVRMAKRLVNASATALDSAISQMDADQFLLTQGMDDATEGIDAFFARRDPSFKGN